MAGPEIGPHKLEGMASGFSKASKLGFSSLHRSLRFKAVLLDLLGRGWVGGIATGMKTWDPIGLG